MRITADTNVLVRGAVKDDLHQVQAADKALRAAEIIAVTLPALCEMAWVLRSVYHLTPAEIASAIRALISVGTVAVDGPAVQAGLILLDAGGDFADGVIAFQGKWMGGDTFISFDRRAVALLQAQGKAAQLLV